MLNYYATYTVCEFDKIPIYGTGENCVFILKLFNKGTAHEYDDMFTSPRRDVNISKAECGVYFTLVIFRTYIFEMFRTYIFVPS